MCCCVATSKLGLLPCATCELYTGWCTQKVGLRGLPQGLLQQRHVRGAAEGVLAQIRAGNSQRSGEVIYSGQGRALPVIQVVAGAATAGRSARLLRLLRWRRAPLPRLLLRVIAIGCFPCCCAAAVTVGSWEGKLSCPAAAAGCIPIAHRCCCPVSASWRLVIRHLVLPCCSWAPIVPFAFSWVLLLPCLLLPPLLLLLVIISI